MLTPLFVISLALASTVSNGAILRALSASDFTGFRMSGVKLNKGDLVLDPTAIQQASDKDGPARDKTYVWGEATSAPLVSDADFDEMVVSWNAVCPPGSWIVIDARARKNNDWTAWYNLGWWSLDQSVIKRTSVKKQNDENGKVNTDTLYFTRPQRQVEVRMRLCSLKADVTPRVKRIFVDVSKGVKVLPGNQPYKSAWGTVLDVPEISQNSYPPDGGVWCSPTSVTMVMNYWAAKKNLPEWTTDVRKTAAGVYDVTFGGTGNWVFNAAFAGCRAGLIAYVQRMDGYREIEKWIARGVPVILSIDNNILHGWNNPGNAGHLIVCVGFDHEGNPVVNDPATRLEKGQTVRRTYQRDKLLAAWSDSRGTAYIIYPENLEKK